MSLTHFCALSLCASGFVTSAANLPSGTELQVRLTSEVSSQQPAGQPVSAVLIAPVLANGAPVLGTGVTVTGVTAEAVPFQPATDQSAAPQIAKLRLNFNKIQDQAGHAASIASVVGLVDNARETVDNSGLIVGIDPSQTYEAQLNRGIAKLQKRSSGLGQILSGVQSAFLKEVDASVDYKPGVEMTLKLTSPLTWTAPVTTKQPAAIAPADRLAALVNSEPVRTVAQKPPSPSDLTNIMLIGSAEQVQTAFQNAGWFSAAALNKASKMETARAMIEDRGYSEAPMSILYLEDRPPDLALQKQNNTFAMRHHIRIWQRSETFNNQPVWVAAATHDIKVSFSHESRSFSHGIDPNIDLERAKVVNDLLATGTVRGLALVQRNNIPKNASNATGDHLTTDGQMAVVQF